MHIICWVETFSRKPSPWSGQHSFFFNMKLRQKMSLWKTISLVRWRMLTLRSLFCNIYIYKIIMLYTLNLCYISIKPGGKRTTSPIGIFRQRLTTLLCVYVRAIILHFKKGCNWIRSITWINVLETLKTALVLYYISKYYSKTTFQYRLWHHILCSYDYHLFPNRKFFFGGLLAYKMIKLTPGYASLSLKKAV